MVKVKDLHGFTRKTEIPDFTGKISPMQYFVGSGIFNDSSQCVIGYIFIIRRQL